MGKLRLMDWAVTPRLFTFLLEHFLFLPLCKELFFSDLKPIPCRLLSYFRTNLSLGPIPTVRRPYINNSEAPMTKVVISSSFQGTLDAPVRP